ncbi:LysR family transcriptional regulator [Marinobacterium nitratireducens]|uniref:LysR family transcriptional regulator n=1 Tax=Marinobacterium nitratireducens TaxID=518897 RepID=A0A917ZIZ7_9GAMM|nr:LysR family transcriptional regulator [Marinobacterium nitratireducens]GGO83407.1 LysR family transcriptional regulator [Marinobacterium nitratireducens]
MDPRHLVYLAVILDKGSITSAAKHLLVAQPTLTRIMATLEMQAGTQLFSRSRFGVRSTPMGEALAREGRAIMRNMDLAQEQVSRYRTGMNQELRVAIGPMIGMAIIPELVDRLTLEHPRMAITVTSSSPTTALDALLDDLNDVVIAPAPHERMLAGIHRELLVEDELGIFCSANHPLAKKESLAIDDFESAKWLSVGLAGPFEEQFIKMLTSEGIKKIKTQTVFKNDAVMMINLLARGHHLAVLPRFPTRAITRPDTITELDLGSARPTERNIYLWTSEKVIDSEAYGHFKQELNTVFGQLLGQQLKPPMLPE